MLRQRLLANRDFIQVLMGPRQVGKTTIAYQTIQDLAGVKHYASADDVGGKGTLWIEEQWNTARLMLKSSQEKKGFLILDGVQKVGPAWSEPPKKIVG